MSESVQQEEKEQQDPSQELNDELEKLRRDISRQIQSNQRFLEIFLDDDFPEEEME